MDIKNVIRKISPKKALDALFVGAVIAMGLFLDWKTVEIVVFSIFILIVLNPIPSRYPALAAIFFLVLTPIALVAEKVDLADRLAIYAYYFLVMTVVMGIYELKKDSAQEKN